MFFSMLSGMFGWLPLPLRSLISVVFIIFAIFVAIALIKTIFTLMQFVVNMLTGIFGKVASLFM